MARKCPPDLLPERNSMGIKSDRWIKKMALEQGMIKPFIPSQVSQAVISYGLSSYGYDIRLADEFKLFSPQEGQVVDPKAMEPGFFRNFKGTVCIIPPHSFVLGRTVEYFRIPRNVFTLCVGKSTYARCGILLNITPLEPEWEGFITMEISNHSHSPAKLYANEGIAQVIFFETDEKCELSYRDKKGIYQAQEGIILSKVKESE